MDYPVVLQLNVLLAFLPNFFSEGGYLPSLSICSNRTEVLKDEYVLFQCTTSCSKSISWIKDNLHVGSTREKLFFLKAAEKDSGLYQCQCENHESNTVDLKVKEVIIEVTPQTVTEGDTVTFHCSTRKYANYFKFFKDQRLMTDGWTENGMVFLHNVAKTDEGEYYCSFYQRRTYISSKIHLRVSDFFHSVTLSPHPSSNVSDTSSLSLWCDSRHRSPLDQAEILYTFYHESQIQSMTHQPWYNISRAQYSVTDGKYYCVASIDKKNIKKESNVVNIYIQALPLTGVALQMWPGEGRVPEGDELILGCSVETSSMPVWFSWYRSRNKWSGFESGTLARKKSYERTAQIVLTVMNETDSGNYNCLANYEEEMEVPSLYANVSVLVSITGVNLSISTSNHNTTLLCSAESISQYLVISWIKDGTPLSIPPTLASAYVTEQEKLHIDTSQLETHGTYWCSVYNEMLPGNSSWSNSVQVYAQPGATHAVFCVTGLSVLALISAPILVFLKKHRHSRGTSHSPVPQVTQEENRRDSLGPTLHYKVQRGEEVQYATVSLTQENRGRRDRGEIEETSGNSAVIYSTITQETPPFERLDPLYSNAKTVFD